MKRKVWWISVPIATVVIGTGCLMYFWNLLTPYWQAEQRAAEYVLNHTPIDRLESYSVFTADGVEDVFRGQDQFGRSWYAFYVPQLDRSFVLPASAVLPEREIAQRAAAYGMQVESIVLGYVANTNASASWAKAGTAVYEVTGRSHGHLAFLYFNASTGQLLWKYALVSS
ncbi:hypothetical protein [Alicyclobacillus vulcanalis]|uniref:Uncharacterized protein YpmB n=1 Tax=Alicyclobacillus vulcanalis TaxID=252246 RepID=A0A1N7NF00_9BACL|nr:hypothetical protein [Alicyclobacillus vulcanalis]SIS96934.1 Uncharacterized protein YpmB [Alicyclobacillus vulcanalis]